MRLILGPCGAYYKGTPSCSRYCKSYPDRWHRHFVFVSLKMATNNYNRKRKRGESQQGQFHWSVRISMSVEIGSREMSTIVNATSIRIWAADQRGKRETNEVSTEYVHGTHQQVPCVQQCLLGVQYNTAEHSIGLGRFSSVSLLAHCQNITFNLKLKRLFQSKGSYI